MATDFVWRSGQGRSQDSRDERPSQSRGRRRGGLPIGLAQAPARPPSSPHLWTLGSVTPKWGREDAAGRGRVCDPGQGGPGHRGRKV